jgi:hypothetical protein
MRKYGVMLEMYGSHEMNMWIFECDEEFSFLNKEDAIKLLQEYQSRNPKGIYTLKENETDQEAWVKSLE